jgi:hypothetical protein
MLLPLMSISASSPLTDIDPEGFTIKLGLMVKVSPVVQVLGLAQVTLEPLQGDVPVPMV